MPDEKKQLHEVRRFSGEEKRVESGPIMFGDDWPGLFLRGDDCMRYVGAVRDALYDNAQLGLITRRLLEGLISGLESSDCRNNDAFPTWHNGHQREVT